TGRLTIINGTLAVDTTGDNVYVGAATNDSPGFLTVGTDGILGSAATPPLLFVGQLGGGTLTVQNNGAVFLSQMRIAFGTGVPGTVTVTGAQARMDATGSITIGDENGTGALTVSSGAEVTSTSTTTIGNGSGGNAAGGSGTLTVTGSGSHWTQTGALTV